MAIRKSLPLREQKFLNTLLDESAYDTLLSRSSLMRISKRGEYALRAMIDLGISEELGRPLLQINELAEKEKLPVKFLEQILMQLKGAGYVASKRGKRGGYHLGKPMDTIKFGSVVRLIDGPLAPIACVSQSAYERCTCPDEVHCGLRMLMFDVRNAISDILDKYSLADIVQITLRKMKRDRVQLPFFVQMAGSAPVGARPASPFKPKAA